MTDLFIAALVFALLCGASWLGHLALRILPAAHRTHETLDFARLAASLMVTFTALVLGLLIASVNTSFDKTAGDVQTYASNLIRLTSCLDDLGSSTRSIRESLRAYTASAVASTWDDEAPPSGSYPKAVARSQDFDASNLTDLLRTIEAGIRETEAPGAAQTAVKTACLSRLDAVLDERWTLIGEAHSTITQPFFYMMVFWLLVVFLSFGITAPRNWLATAFVLLVGMSVAGAVYVILELDGPLDGMVKVSSEPMRHALMHMDWSLNARPDP